MSKINYTNKQLLIFDMDGTILNTLNDLMDATNYALKLNNFPIRSYEQIRCAVGNGVAMLIKRSLPSDIDQETYKKVLSDFEKYYSLHSSDKTEAYKGMFEALTSLKNKGYLLACATNKIEEVAIELVNRFYPNLFSTVCGDNGVRAKKPAADCVNEITKRLNVTDKNKIIYIGDSEVDYQTALNSDVDCLIVTYGYRTKDELTKLSIDAHFIEKPIDLIDIF